MKVLILTCGTGTGHNVAAAAIGEQLKKQGVDFDIFDSTYLGRDDKIKNNVTRFHNDFILKNKVAFGITYYSGAFMYYKLGLSPVYLLNKKHAKYLKAYLDNNKVDAILCTHMYALNTVFYLKKKCGLNIPCHALLTDYLLHPFFTHKKYNFENENGKYFIAGTPGTINELKHYKFPDSAIYTTGIPVAERINTDLTKEKAREVIGLDNNKKYVLIINSRDGSTFKIVKNVVNNLPGDCHCIFVSCNDNKIQKKIEKKIISTKLTIVNYIDNMEVYLRACDVLVTKAGGLMTTEAGVVGIPIVHVNGMPGLENGNAKYFSSFGMSHFSRRVSKNVSDVIKLLENEDLRKQMVAKQREFIPQNSAQMIAKEIING